MAVSPLYERQEHHDYRISHARTAHDLSNPGRRRRFGYLDGAADAAVVGLDDIERRRIEQSVTVLNAPYGAPERLAKVAKDIVGHWKNRREVMDEYIGGHGKALIVCATREICANLYEQIVALEPEWESDSPADGVVKVVYSGSAKDPQPICKHVRWESENKALTNRLEDENDPLELVIVQNILLTGFDAPPLHTLYLDRPIQGALLMQTLARVNRTFEGKQDAEQCKAEGRPLPADIKRALDKLLADSTASGAIIDIYAAAGMPKPSLTELTLEFERRTLESEHPHLAIEALRDALTDEVRHSTRNNLVRQKAFSKRLRELMNKYTNQQLTSAQVSSALVELAREAAKERDRGAAFTPAAR